MPSITRDFSGVNISQARINPTSPAAPIPAFHQIEPEFAAISGNTVYVTLQDNNAIGVFNLAPNLADSNWTEVRGLGTRTQTVDASWHLARSDVP